MITAKDARCKVEQSRHEACARQMAEICNKIVSACERHEYQTDYRGDLFDDNYKLLLSNGYHLNRLGDGWIISW